MTRALTFPVRLIPASEPAAGSSLGVVIIKQATGEPVNKVLSRRNSIGGAA